MVLMLYERNEIIISKFSGFYYTGYNKFDYWMNLKYETYIVNV